MEDKTTAVTTIVTSTALDVLILGWIDAKKHKSGSERTRQAYSDTLNQFRGALKQLGLDLDSQDDQALTTIALTAQAFASYSSVPGRQVRPATRNQRLAILSSFYEYAIRQVALEHNPIKRVERSKVQSYGNARALTNDETEERLTAIDRSTLQGKRDYALLAVLLYTGRRLSEVQSLELCHLTLTTGKITVAFEHTKGNEQMSDLLPFTATNALLDWLQAYYGADLVPGATKDTRPVWVALSNSGHKNGRTRIGDQLGPQAIADICARRLGTSKVHATRHTWAHGMDEIGAPASTIQARLGHKSLATTGRYLAQLKQADNPYADKLAAHLGIK
jgi:integrase/recombinase XerC